MGPGAARRHLPGAQARDYRTFSDPVDRVDI